MKAVVGLFLALSSFGWGVFVCVLLVTGAPWQEAGAAAGFAAFFLTGARFFMEDLA